MTARQTIAPVQQPRTSANAPLDITAGLTAGGIGANTGVSFANTGHEALYVKTATGATTATVNIGETVEGQTPPGLSFNLTTVGDVFMLGPFAADEDQPGGTVTVDFGTPANVAGVLLVQNVGVTT